MPVAIIAPLLVIALLCVAGTAVAVMISDGSDTASDTVAAASPSPSPQKILAAGDCVSGASVEYALTPCPGGTHKVLAALSSKLEPCPAETDVIGNDSNEQILCLLSHAEPHPGAPGAGGGVLRAGDCLNNVELDSLVEVPCADAKAFHKITAIVKDRAQCQPPAIRGLFNNTLGGDPIVCAEDATGIASPGECVAWVKDEQAPSDVPTGCDARPVWKFTGRVSDSKKCGKWSSTWWYTRPPGALPPNDVYCYRKLG